MNLRLEPLSLDHLPDIMTWVNDHDIMQYFATHQKDISEEEERNYLTQILQSKNDRVFSIFNEETGLRHPKYVGQCSLNAIYWPARNARLFIVITKDNHNKGYGPEAIRRLIEYAFQEMKLHKIWLIVRSDNRHAQAMYLKLGFNFEGLLKDEYCVNGIYYDMVRMSIINPNDPE